MKNELSLDNPHAKFSIQFAIQEAAFLVLEGKSTREHGWLIVVEEMANHLDSLLPSTKAEAHAMFQALTA